MCYTESNSGAQSAVHWQGSFERKIPYDAVLAADPADWGWKDQRDHVTGSISVNGNAIKVEGWVFMKKILFVIFMLYLTIAGAFAQEQTTVSQFQGQKITEIEAHGVFSIIVRQGTSTGVTVNIPARFEKQLVLRLNPDGKLQIHIEGKITSKNRRNNDEDQFTAEVTVTTLNQVKLTGVCKLETIGDFTTNKLKVDLSGASKMLVGGDFLAKEKLETERSLQSQRPNNRPRI